MTNSAQYFIDYFITNKVQCRTFKNDDKLTAKLEGIQSAIDEGYLRTTKLIDGVRVSATNKLTALYNKNI
jgi:hypothetical protein